MFFSGFRNSNLQAKQFGEEMAQHKTTRSIEAAEHTEMSPRTVEHWDHTKDCETCHGDVRHRLGAEYRGETYTPPAHPSVLRGSN